MVITLRDVADTDEPLLLDLFDSARNTELSLMNLTSEQRRAFVKMQSRAQHFHYRERFPDAEFKVILRDDEPVGRLYIYRGKDQIRILDINLLPAHRGAGIGTPLIQGSLDEGASTGRTVRVYVETYSPSRRLFERLGFSAVEDDGFNVLFEWRPADRSPGP
jgi:RimJ/RimL family protein N-acetyltransferase